MRYVWLFCIPCEANYLHCEMVSHSHFYFQVVDIERDIKKAKGGAGDDLVYKTITGLKSDLSVESKPVLLQNKETSAASTNAHGMCSYVVHCTQLREKS